MLDMSEIRALTSGRHPARTLDFDELYDGLWERVHQGHINTQTNSTRTREIFNYSHSCTYDRAWDQFTLMARGLIIDPIQKRILCTPFGKFFNFGELGYDVPDEPFTVTSKMDGSLGICGWHENEWFIATRGSFESDQAKWATKWFRENVKSDCLHPGYTYLLEIIFRENKIVVSYPFEGLVLLGAYNEWGDEMNRQYLDDIACESGMMLVETRSFNSVNDIVEIAKGLPYNDEGFVVRFADGFRLKIKGDEYTRVHRVVSNITPLGVWEIMMECGDVAEVRRIIPEEFLVDFNTIYGFLEKEFTSRYQSLQEAVALTQGLCDKELGQAIQSGGLDLLPEVCGFIFACRKKGFLDAVKVAGGSRQRFFRMFRPTGNRLVGYAPTNMMTRFTDESE